MAMPKLYSGGPCIDAFQFLLEDLCVITVQASTTVPDRPAWSRPPFFRHSPEPGLLVIRLEFPVPSAPTDIRFGLVGMPHGFRAIGFEPRPYFASELFQLIHIYYLSRKSI